MRHSSTAQTRASTARYDGHAHRVASLEHGLHLGIGFWQHNHQRPLAVGGQAITFIRGGVLKVPQQRMCWQNSLQCRNHARLAAGAGIRVVVGPIACLCEQLVLGGG